MLKTKSLSIPDTSDYSPFKTYPNHSHQKCLNRAIKKESSLPRALAARTSAFATPTRGRARQSSKIAALLLSLHTRARRNFSSPIYARTIDSPALCITHLSKGFFFKCTYLSRDNRWARRRSAISRVILHSRARASFFPERVREEKGMCVHIIYVASARRCDKSIRDDYRSRYGCFKLESSVSRRCRVAKFWPVKLGLLDFWSRVRLSERSV